MSANHRYGARAALAAVACLALASCSSFNNAASGMSASNVNPVNWITPYKVDVIQGNFVSSEQVALLRVGMPRDQIKALMGTPLLSSLFHANRWDYVFTLKRQGVEPQSYKYTVYFKDDRLERFEGDTMPSEAEFIAKLDNKRKLGEVPQLQATEEQLNKAAEKSSPAPASTTPSTPPPPTGPATIAYPPLESTAK